MQALHTLSGRLTGRGVSMTMQVGVLVVLILAVAFGAVRLHVVSQKGGKGAKSTELLSPPVVVQSIRSKIALFTG